MTNKTKKIILSLFISITAVVFFTLPFFMDKKEIYLYSTSPLSVEENGFVKELKKLGYKTRYQTSKQDEKSHVTIWFGGPETIKQIQYSKAEYNFLYVEEYDLVSLEGAKIYPIILTPHKSIYEHYMRSNIKTAWLDIKDAKGSAIKIDQILKWIEAN